jgi:LssY C-terminus
MRIFRRFAGVHYLPPVHRNPACWLLLLVGLLPACATFQPAPLEQVPFHGRAETKRDGAVHVSAVVLSAEESAAVFGVPLAEDGIQPVWLRIENGEDLAYFFFPTAVDPNHFSPQEAAWKSRITFGGDANTRMSRYFDERKMPILIPPRSTVEGFVYTKLDEGVKYLSVLLFHPKRTRQFEFVVPVPGIQLLYHRLDFAALRQKFGVQEVDDEGLRQALEQLPCCTQGPDLQTPGDPLNLVIIGSGLHTFIPFVRSGWDPTETLSRRSVWRTIASSLFADRYRTSPISPLFVFARHQDVALQKARATVDERNHFRVWLTPLRYQGMDVWIGQISRDIGVRLSSKTFVTHKIDPDVDDARYYLVQDLARSGGLVKIGWVAGVGQADMATPRFNYTGDPYYTDGIRVVMMMGGTARAPGSHSVLSMGRPAEPGASGVPASPPRACRASRAGPAATVSHGMVG